MTGKECEGKGSVQIQAQSIWPVLDPVGQR